MKSYSKCPHGFRELILRKPIKNTDYKIGFHFTHEIGLPLGIWVGNNFKSIPQKYLEEMIQCGIFEVNEKKITHEFIT